MMASSSIIILRLQSYWPVLFLIMATILNERALCYAQKVTCATLGCYADFKHGGNCQCDRKCYSHRNCCDDFVDCGSCEDIQCGSRYNQSRLCHCNDRCREFKTCCSDYDDICDFTAIEQTTIETPEKGTTALVIITTTSVSVIIVAVIVLVFCVTLRRKRIYKPTEEMPEERKYYEIGIMNERSHEGDPAGDKRNQYNRNIGNNTSTSSINSYEGQFVANVAYESYR